ncbi:MAG: metalloregulator ArsR/SmtB family transcription factor [Patescibacteria group bacterium]
MTEKEMEKVMKALANRRRLLILKFLKKQKESSVGDIAEEIKLSFKATSKHLSVLSNAGIVDREQRSLQMFYSLVAHIPESARRIISLL